MKSVILGPLESPTTLRGATVWHLRKAIVAGELPPGFLLKEVELAKRLKVSATPVREALAELAAEGLVEIEPNRLKRVAPLNPEGILQTLGVQSILWRQGYIWGIPNIGQPEIARLAALVEQYEAEVRADHRLKAIEAGIEFHALIIRAAGNSELLRVTLDRRSALARFALLSGSLWQLRTGPQQNRKIFNAIERGNLELALMCLDELTEEIVGAAQRAIAKDKAATTA